MAVLGEGLNYTKELTPVTLMLPLFIASGLKGEPRHVVLVRYSLLYCMIT
jgi:hypothetical protein